MPVNESAALVDKVPKGVKQDVVEAEQRRRPAVLWLGSRSGRSSRYRAATEIQAGSHSIWVQVSKSRVGRDG